MGTWERNDADNISHPKGVRLHLSAVDDTDPVKGLVGYSVVGEYDSHGGLDRLIGGCGQSNFVAPRQITCVDCVITVKKKVVRFAPGTFQGVTGPVTSKCCEE